MSLRKDSDRRDPPFERILIANRGEIALRLIRACHELGSEAVAVYSDADEQSVHVRAADRALRIGPPPPAESYLRIAAIVEAARASAADAVHPGYGFLSERAELAEACADAGLVFIGPGPDALRRLGDKLAARATAAGVGVPIVPGTLEPLPLPRPGADGRELLGEAEQIGWPLLVKAAGGGGGRGMRRVDSAEELAGAVTSAAREAAAAFGDGAVYLERFVERARHVEVQLLGDAQGRIVALGERDCSVQRRHQKLVEEAPAPGLSEAQRTELHGLAVRVGEAVGLRNAATAEFLLTPEGNFWFLEVNARLQVEHGVTELVAGIDLVHEQLWIAAGEPLSQHVLTAAARAAAPERHSIEVRVSAEDPAADFAPAPGTITHWREPGGPGVRLDAGFAAGSRVPAEYDPLLAKLLVVANDRAAALARMRRALAEFEVGGLQTTLPFYRWLIDQGEFTSGDGLSTDLVARSWRPEAVLAGPALRAAELAARAAAERRPASFRKSSRRGSATSEAERWWQAGIGEAMEQRR